MSEYNEFITSTDKNKCIDCGSSKIVFEEDEESKSTKRCLTCGKEYYV